MIVLVMVATVTVVLVATVVVVVVIGTVTFLVAVELVVAIVVGYHEKVLSSIAVKLILRMRPINLAKL